MSWTERLNDALPRVRLGAAVVDIHEWAHSDQPVDAPPHRHSFFVVGRVEAGKGEFTAAERCHLVGPGDLLIARPGVRHRTVADESFQISWIAFEVASAATGDDETSLVLQGFLTADIAVVKDAGPAGILWEVLKETARGPRSPGQRATLAALAPALLISVARAGGGGGRGVRQGGESAREGEAGRGAAGGDEGAARGDCGDMPPQRHLRAVRMAVRYIADNLDRPLRVEELAKQVGVSPRQLTRLFATILNEPPASYVERVRLDRAASMLAQTRQPIKQIAAELGYPDVPTFTRAFARQHNSPPGRFRRTHLDPSTVDQID